MKILIVRLSAIGDVVMATSLLTALRHSYPDSWISWLVEPGAAPLLLENPALNEVLLWQRKEWEDLLKKGKWFKLFKRFRTFQKSLQEKQFDWAIDCQGLLKSASLAWLSGAKRRIGVQSKEGSRFLMTEVIKEAKSDFVGSEYQILAKYLGLKEYCSINLPASQKTQKMAKSLLLKHSIGSSYVCFAPFTTREQKHWFFDYWLELAREIEKKEGLKCLILGGSNNKEIADTMVEGSNNLISFVGKTSLIEASEVIRNAKCLIGVDTGLTHMGLAHNTPTIALFGSTRPYLRGYTNNVKVLYLGLTCSPCKRHPTCGGSYDCLRGIFPEDVMRSFQELLRKNVP